VARTVVIVDDHAGFRSGACALLRDEGYEVVGEAADGRSGLEVVGRTDPDLVLLDVQLPDVSGFEVAEHLVRVAPRTRVILISSRTASDYGDRLTSAAAPFVSKSDLTGDALAVALRAGA
jgi:DNA-binding NarL/FixJ family response regulator